MRALQRLQQQAERTRTAPNVRVAVQRGRMAFRIGSVKLWVPGYTVTVISPRAVPFVVRVRTAKSASDVMRGISIGSLTTTS